MTFITPQTLNTINLEFTNYCNAACPMCARFRSDGSLYKEKVNNAHNKLEVLKKRIPESIIKQLHTFYSVGTYGEPVINPQCLEIYQWVRSLNKECRLLLHTNGGARDRQFWKQLAETGVQAVYGIDGLADTNHLYRRNVKWDKLMNNVKSFIDAGGDARWTYIVFKHNQHQIEEAREMADSMGFKTFNTVFTDRWKHSNWVTGATEDVDKWPVDDYFLEKPILREQCNPTTEANTVGIYEEKKFNLTTPIKCKMASDNTYEIYIRANGDVQPCCMLGDLDVHEPKNIIHDPKSVNLNHNNLVDILNGDFFRRLDTGINKGSKDRLKNCFYTCALN